MRIAITGTTGRVGRALANRLEGPHEIIELPRAVLDLSVSGCEQVILDLDFDVLLNPAGLTSLEYCKDHQAEARRINGVAPAALMWACRKREKPMLHFSTDYVFDGMDPGMVGEDDETSPISTYGKSKAEGEHVVLATGGSVARLSWVFGPEKPAFPDMILERALAGEPLEAVSDKFSLPSYTGDIAVWVGAWLTAGCPMGLFHACNSGPPVSWHGIAVEVVDFLREQGRSVSDVTELKLDDMTEFRSPRPRYTAMSTTILEKMLGQPPRDWRVALREHLASSLISR